MVIRDKIFEAINSVAKNNANEVVLVTPFLSLSTLKQLLDNCTKTTSLILITQANILDYAIGYNSVDAWKEIWSRGGTVYLCKQLHAKYYRFDNAVFLGSANLTDNGFGISKNSNIELMTEMSFNKEIKEVERALLENSVRLNPTNEKVCEFERQIGDLKANIEQIRAMEKETLFRMKPIDFTVADMSQHELTKLSTQNKKELKMTSLDNKVTEYESCNGVIDVMKSVATWGNKMTKDKKKVSLYTTPNGLPFVLVWVSSGLKRNAESEYLCVALHPNYVNKNNVFNLGEDLSGKIYRNSNMKDFPKAEDGSHTEYGFLIIVKGKDRLRSLLEKYDRLAS